MPICGEVLVVVVNHRSDLEIIRHQHWYRIPTEQVAKLKQQDCWCPQWLAFYQTKVFDAEAFAIRYYANVVGMTEATRQELFPQEPLNSKSDKCYCKLALSPLQTLATPIASQQLRRIAFIPTTWAAFSQATEIKDLWQQAEV